MDVLSESLERIQFRAGIPGRALLRAPWGFRHPPPDQYAPLSEDLPHELQHLAPVARPRFGFFYVVTEGRCLLEVSGREPAPLGSGDLVMLTRPTDHTLRDSSRSPARSLFDYIPVHSMPHGPTLRIDGGEGASCSLLFGTIVLRGYVGGRLLDSLPELLHLGGQGEHGTQSWLPQIVQVIAAQSAQIGPGSMALINRLVQILFCQAVRHYIAQLDHRGGRANWLHASLDPQIGPALSALHERMSHPWTVESIAAEVAMSRSAFASRFNLLVGAPPLQYLTNIRMERACMLLSFSSAPVKEISREIGYASEAAFSTAFRRQFSMTPIDFRRKGTALYDHVRRPDNEQVYTRSTALA